MRQTRAHLWSPQRKVQPPKPSPQSAGPKRGLEFERVTSAPMMARRNGFGTILLGRISDPRIEPARVKLLWVTLLFVPVLPLHAYAVTGDFDGYRFHGQMNLLAFARRYRWRVLPYLISVVIEAILRAILVLALIAIAYLSVAWLFGRI
jgi:hypothetical protein